MRRLTTDPVLVKQKIPGGWQFWECPLEMAQFLVDMEYARVLELNPDGQDEIEFKVKGCTLLKIGEY